MGREDMYREMLEAAWHGIKMPTEPVSPPSSFSVGFFQGLRYLIGYIDDTTSPPIDTEKLMERAEDARTAVRRLANERQKRRRP